MENGERDKKLRTSDVVERILPTAGHTPQIITV